MARTCTKWIFPIGAYFFIGFVPLVWTQLQDTDFNPQVSATCKADHTMNIRVNFNSSFHGTIHARDYRTPACMSVGDGGKSVTLNISLLAPQGSAEYCGLLVNNKTQEKSVPVAVRIHRTLELASDKFYVITCGKASFKTNQSSPVSLQLLDGERRVTRAVYSNQYTLRIEISKPDSSYGFRVKNCFAFNRANTSVILTDERGCPAKGDAIGAFTYNEAKGIADAPIRSMFKFPESSEVHFQCDVALCKGACLQPSCSGDVSNSLAINNDEGVLMAANTVFVLDPSEAPLAQELCDETGGVHPSWLLWLCVAFGVLFLIMLIINIFLCSAMTCACARTEIIEKEPSIIEDYDPYRSWHGSQYGSRYSLNGAPQHPKGYTSGGSTLNSARSISSHSDHYAIVHSRPGSRGYNTKSRGPPSHIGSHYSGK
ncbi:uncharacterized protein LOC109545561 isoform X1 [Dendroctonus ponderosae]|uniref:ZP domain-containing protein n=3 Tax=Dendroctonus ponderosae TaxID=77166 RepID=J3JWK8_DENPD|nr:uncharacterized protein LOC109545561 isoform X1 [Dendroctonus ponderosae]AEE62588.1 unknown [Dendroctonus ponderosae]ERL88354.1 hypothetical protein D910_05741 [Dendroctonus ponderosae]